MIVSGGVELRIKAGHRGVSNVIVVMLSLILVVIVVANVFLWQFQMNQFDWERMQEKVEVLDVAPLTPAWYYLGFNYRVQHNITGSSVGVLADYQVAVTIVNGSGLSSGNTYYTNHVSQPDFDDVRFTWYNATSGPSRLFHIGVRWFMKG